MHAILKSILPNEKLCIADVGAAGGPELRWKPWEAFCFFYTFDPDPRTKQWSCPSRNYPTGLWSHPCTQTLHLASYPPASSLFKPNTDWLSSFPTSKAMQETGLCSIELEALDRVLADQKVDFLKIDAEGAELEILKGAQEKISHECLGLQLEALFCPIRHNAPTFADLDIFVRNFDFQLFQIQREHWIRNNHIASYESAPQLIWGNVLYLLPKKAFLSRLKASPNPTALFGKYMVILFAYHLYDYAFEVCEAVELEEAEAVKNWLRALGDRKESFFDLILSLSVGAGKYALSFSRQSKQHRLNYLKRKMRQLGHACLYISKNDFALYD